MGLVALDQPPADLHAGRGWKWVAWDDGNGETAYAALRRAGHDTVELQRLVSSAQAPRDDRRSLLDAIADVVAARELVAEVRLHELSLYESSGFVAAADTGERVRCVRSLEIAADPSPRSAVTLAGFEAAIRSSWCAETSDDPASWSPENPARNQCDVTALLVRELLGGEILIANVVKDGRRIERHAWNRLPSGLEVDLTRCQYSDGEELATPRVSEPMGLGRLAERYELLAGRVRAELARPYR